jgi:hypothetical protein
MIRVFIRHSVANYAQWRVVYDEFDPNAITVTHDFADAETARAFVASDRLREVMAEAGVVDAPQVWSTQAAWAIPRGLWPHYWGHEYNFGHSAYWST